jgi:hypothetical protein
MTRRLRLGLWFFAALAILEVGDLVGLIITLRDPGPAADMLGISRNGQIVRAIVLVLLAGQVVLGSLMAAFNLVRRNWLWFRMGGLLTSVGLVIYGGFQIISAVVQLGNVAVAVIGAVYVALGLLAFYFARSPVSVPASDG